MIPYDPMSTNRDNPLRRITAVHWTKASWYPRIARQDRWCGWGFEELECGHMVPCYIPTDSHGKKPSQRRRCLECGRRQDEIDMEIARVRLIDIVRHPLLDLSDRSNAT
jgi:hypothetical protein